MNASRMRGTDPGPNPDNRARRGGDALRVALFATVVALALLAGASFAVFGLANQTKQLEWRFYVFGTLALLTLVFTISWRFRGGTVPAPWYAGALAAALPGAVLFAAWMCTQGVPPRVLLGLGLFLPIPVLVSGFPGRGGRAVRMLETALLNLLAVAALAAYFHNTVELLPTARLALLSGAASVLTIAGALCAGRLDLAARADAVLRRRLRPRALYPACWALLAALASGALFLWIQRPIDYHHYAPFVGPIHDWAHGKSLLRDTPPSIYGYGSVWFCATVLRPWGVSFLSFHYLNLAAYVLYYLLAAMLAARVLRNAAAAVAVFLLLACLHTLFAGNTHAMYPSSGALRFLPGLGLCAALVFLEGRARAAVALTLAAMAALWSPEAGVYVLPAWMFACAVHARAKHGAFAAWLRRIALCGGLTLAAVALALAAVVAVEHRPGAGWPRLGWFYLFVSRYTTHPHVPLLEPVANYYLMVPVLLLGVATAFLMFWRRHDGRLTMPMAFLAAHNTALFSYYVTQPRHEYGVNLTVFVLAEFALVWAVWRDVFGVSPRRLRALMLFPVALFCLLYAQRCEVTLPAQRSAAVQGLAAPEALLRPGGAGRVRTTPALRRLVQRLGAPETPVALWANTTDTLLLTDAGMVNALPFNPGYATFEVPDWESRFLAPSLEALPPGALFAIDARLDHGGDPARRRVEEFYGLEPAGLVVEPAPAMHDGAPPPEPLRLHVYRLRP